MHFVPYCELHPQCRCFDGKLRNKLEEKYSDPEIFDDLLHEAYYNVSIRGVQEKVYLDVDKDGTGEKEFYICRTCKHAFHSNKLPSRCIFNECWTADQPDPLRNMTEIEATLISQNLQFQKIHHLLESRWAESRDRVINGPTLAINVKKTIESLPRNPIDPIVGLSELIGNEKSHRKIPISVNLWM